MLSLLKCIRSKSFFLLFETSGIFYDRYTQNELIAYAPAGAAVGE